MTFKALTLLIILFSVGLTQGVQLSDPLPANDSSDQDFLDYLALCSETDPDLISPEVLAHYQMAVRHINDGGVRPKVCWMAPGEASDLGWSFQEYKAVNVINFCFKVEAAIRSSVTEEESYAVMRDLIEEDDCNILFPISFEFQFAISVLAPQYPDVMFVSPVPIPETGVLDNVRTFAINGYESMYLMGYLSQLMDTTQDIGGVTSLHIVTELQGAYAYWAGLQDAATEEGTEPKTWHLWFTESFSDVDKALFATQDLVERFDVNHVSQTVDPYEPQVWLREQGFTGTGVIADMGLFAGERTLGSQMVRWDIAGLNAYSLLLANGGTGWGNTDMFLPCNAWTGSITFGTLSSLVSHDIQEKVRARYAFLQSSPFATFSLWCGDRVLPLLQPGQTLDQNGCMNFAQVFNISVVHPGIDYLGTYEIPLEEITLSDGVKIAAGILSGLSLLFTLICMVTFTVRRNTTMIKVSSYWMTIISLFGSVMSLIGVILYIPDPTDDLCQASLAMYAIGFYITFGAFASKIYGFTLIKEGAKTFNKVQVSFIQVIWVSIVALIIGLSFTIWWLAVNTASVTLTYEDTTELDKYQIRDICNISSDGEIAIAFMLGYSILLVFIVLIVHYMLSNKWINAAKIDSQRIAIVSWMVIVSAAIALGITLALDNNQDTLEIVVFFCAWLAATSIVLFYSGPKLWVLLVRGDADLGITQTKGTNFSSVRGTTSITGSDQTKSASESQQV